MVFVNHGCERHACTVIRKMKCKQGKEVMCLTCHKEEDEYENGILMKSNQELLTSYGHAYPGVDCAGCDEESETVQEDNNE